MITRENAPTIAQFLIDNASVLDTLALVDQASIDAGSVWYPTNRAKIAEVSQRYGLTGTRLARVIAHLSSGTKWTKQSDTMEALAHDIAVNGANANLAPYTLYAHVGAYAAAHFAAKDDIPGDNPKKTHQFYHALTKDSTQWYTMDSIDLQYRGCLKLVDGELNKSDAVDKCMGSIMVYRAVLMHERRVGDNPTTRQAIRWVWYHDNEKLLKRDKHPLITYDIVMLEGVDEPAIKWRWR